MADKAPCRWVLPKSVQALWGWGDGCIHPVVAHLRGISQAHCNGCPCHEPANLPEFPDSSTAPPDTQRTDPPTTCRWWRDEYGNWCCACSDTMPDFTPWPSADPNGQHCPKCGKPVAATPYYCTKCNDEPGTRTDPPKVHDKP